MQSLDDTGLIAHDSDGAPNDLIDETTALVLSDDQGLVSLDVQHSVHLLHHRFGGLQVAATSARQTSL